MESQPNQPGPGTPSRTLLEVEVLARESKNNRTIKVSKISSIEEFPSAAAKPNDPNVNVDLDSTAGGHKNNSNKMCGGYWKGLLASSSRDNRKHSSTGNLAARQRNQKRHLASSSVPCSAIKTDNNENILGSHSRIQASASGEAETGDLNFPNNPKHNGRVGAELEYDRRILQESQDQNLESQPAGFTMMISSPREVANMSAPTSFGKPSPKRSSKTPGRKLEAQGAQPIKDHRSTRHDKHTHHAPSKSLDRGQEKLTYEKAALILYEDEMVTEKLKAAVSELSGSCEKYRYELKMNEEKNAQEILKLQLENEALLLELSRANESINHWKSKYQRQGNEDVTLSKLKLATKENVSLKEDLDVLKSVIRRLNQEMGFYQDKLRSKYADPAKMPVFTSSPDSNANPESPVRNDLTLPSNRQNYVIVEPRKNLLPLLIAYDEVIEEKNEIIKDHEVTLQKFKAKCQNIVQENEDLHKVITESRETGSISIKEWKFLHDNAVTVLEENELLHEQCKILRSKTEIAGKNHEEEVTQLRSQVTTMEEEGVKLKAHTKDAEDQCAFLTSQISKINAVLQRRIPVDEHDTSIRECRRLFDELKGKYTDETKTLKDKVTALEADKERLASELIEIDAENAKLLASLQSLEKLQSTSKAQLKNVQTELSNATKSKDVTTKAVNEIVVLVETVIAERESLRASFYEQQALNEQLMNLRKKESQLVEDLRGKIQLMESVHHEEMERYRSHIAKLEEVLETVGERHQADVLQLRELITEKSAHIEKLGIEKEQLMEDLETVWRATTRDAINSRGMPSPLLKKYNFIKEKQSKE